MGTIHWQDGFRFAIWSMDHPPAHVHAYHGDGLAIVEIETLFVRRYVNMKPKDVVKAVRIVKQNAGKFAMEWRRIHGS
jgi:hypothetical protein